MALALASSMSLETGCYGDRPARHDIPAAGPLDPALLGVDDVMIRVMSQLCIGAGVLAIARDGEVLAARGYGHHDGPPSRECAFVRDRFVGGATIEPDTPMRIGSVGKNIGAILVRRALRDALEVAGLPDDDAAIEALPLVGGPLRLLPPRIEETLLGERAPAFTIDGSACNERADPRWRDVTIGHLLSHRAGLPGAGPDILVGDRLQALRGLWTRESLVREQSSLAPPADALCKRRGHDGFFIPPPDLPDTVLALGSTCLRADPGAGARYSNLGFDILAMVATHVGGRLEVPRGGDLDSHTDSLLDLFLRDELALDAGRASRHGISLSHPFAAARDPAEPRYRKWTPARNYYPNYDDRKRPYCTLQADGRCLIDRCRERGRPFNYQWERRPVPLSYEWIGVPVSTGLLAAEAPVLLEVLRRYWLGRVMAGGHDDGAPFYGRSRALHASPVNRQHGGNLDGATAWVAQFVGAPVDHDIVPLEDDSGRYDFAASFERARCSTIPPGVDLVIAFNQSYSQDCHLDDDCDVAYGAWRSLILAALCEVDWDRVGADPP